MDSKEITKNIIQYQKTNFDNLFNLLVTVQEAGERHLHKTLEQSTYLPEQTQAVLTQTVETLKQGRDAWKKGADKGYQELENILLTSH